MNKCEIVATYYKLMTVRKKNGLKMQAIKKEHIFMYSLYKSGFLKLMLLYHLLIRLVIFQALPIFHQQPIVPAEAMYQEPMH